MCVDMSSGWFDCTEPSLCTALQGKQGVQGTSSGWFTHIEPHRTYSNHNMTELARCAEVCHRSSGWLDGTEPSLSTSLQGKQGVHGAYALVQGGTSTSNHFITEIARCGEFLHLSSGWFDRTETFLSTSLKGKQGVQGA